MSLHDQPIYTQNLIKDYRKKKNQFKFLAMLFNTQKGGLLFLGNWRVHENIFEPVFIVVGYKWHKVNTSDARKAFLMVFVLQVYGEET